MKSIRDSFLQVTYAFSTLPTTPHDGHLQMLPAEAHLATGVASLVKFFGWQRIAVLSGPAPVFSSVSITSAMYLYMIPRDCVRT